MLPRLTRRFRVVTYDARGHGRSGKPSSGYGFEPVVEDALAVIRATRLRKPVIAGHSWGAMAALELAAAHPRAIAGAVLVDGGITTLGRSMDWPTTKERLAPPNLKGLPLEAFRSMIRTFSADALDLTPEVEAIVLCVMRVRSDGTIAPYLSRANHLRILRAIWEQEPVARYEALRVPTLAIVAHEPGADGSDEPWTQAKRAAVAEVRAAAAGRPVTVAWMRGIHDLPLQHPDALSCRIERFATGGVG
jgi:pimeloyl-ACP methyl ester carboxylesterase